MKVLFLSNIPTPNQLDLLNTVFPFFEMKVIFLWNTEHGRDWNLKSHPNATILNYRKNIQTYIRFYKLYKNYDPDVVIVGGYSLPLSLFSYFVSKYEHKAFLYWLEKPNKSTILKSLVKYYYMKIKFSFIHPDTVLCIGNKPTEFYHSFFSNVQNFPYSMELGNYYQCTRESTKKEKIKFLFCGQLINRKNVLNTIKAFTAIDSPNIELNILGTGELLPQVENLIKKDKRCKLLGFIQPENLYKVYHDNDVFILPSLDDGWALVINEAMASSMPIIGTKEVGAIDEFIVHKENGYICTTDIESITNSINYYINHEELIYEHGKLNRRKIQDSLADVNNASQRLNEICKGLIK